MHVRELPSVPRNPLTEEVWVAGVLRLLAREEITEVQRQVLQEWIDLVRPMYVKLGEILEAWDSRPAS